MSVFGVQRGAVVRLDRALRLVWQSAPGWTLSSLVLVVVQAALPVLALYLLKLLVDTVAAGLESTDWNAQLERLGVLLALAGLVGLLGALCRSVASFLTEAQGQVVADRMYDVLHVKSEEVDFEFYEDSRFHDTLHRAQQDAPFRPMKILSGLTQVGQNGLALVAITGLLISFHWAVAAALLLAVLPGTIARLNLSAEIFHWQRRSTETERKAGYLNRLLTERAHAKELRLLGLGPLLRDRFHSVRERLRGERLALVRRRSWASFATEAGATLAVFGSYGFIAYRTLQGEATIGDMFMYFQAFQRAHAYLRDLLTGLTGLYEDNLFLSSFYDFLQLKRRVVDPPNPKPVPRPLKTGIVFEGIGFAYPGTERRVLTEIDLTVRPGETVALVGENGCGKTTLIKLLCRLYDPAEGAILLDGIDLREFSTAALRREIGVLFEDFDRYYLTARENILFGDVNVPAGSERLAMAAKRAGADGVIDSLADGYDTILGRTFGDGTELSAGQWQKLALARTFLREAPILALDEPTSAMDPAAEHDVVQKLQALAGSRTTLIISHRLSTVTWVDRIYVLQRGRIVETGSHQELVRMGGSYAHLFEMQAGLYSKIRCPPRRETGEGDR